MYPAPALKIGSLEHQAFRLWSMAEEPHKLHSDDTGCREIGHHFEKVGEPLSQAWIFRLPGRVECCYIKNSIDDWYLNQKGKDASWRTQSSVNLSSRALQDHLLEGNGKDSEAGPKCRRTDEEVSEQLDLLGMENSTRGKGLRGVVSGTVWWNTPSKVEVSPHVEEGEDKAEEKGFEEIAGLPIPPPLPCFLPYLLQFDALGFLSHLSETRVKTTIIFKLKYLKTTFLSA